MCVEGKYLYKNQMQTIKFNTLKSIAEIMLHNGYYSSQESFHTHPVL